MSQKWLTKFELRPGRWVFVPTPEAFAVGRDIKKAVSERWNAPPHFFHLRAGGHVAALNAHVNHSYFVRVDLQDFFGSINKTRITRCLKGRFSYVTSRDWANASTVRHAENLAKTILPYGFVQSPILASLCLDDSALGKSLRLLRKIPGLTVTVYVDDIIVSTDDASMCDQALNMLKEGAIRSNFNFNMEKMQGPAQSISAFNISLSRQSLLVEEPRLQLFSEVLNSTGSQATKDAIIAYVASVNPTQAAQLER